MAACPLTVDVPELDDGCRGTSVGVNLGTGYDKDMNVHE